MLTVTQHSALFWVFLSFFIIIGITALLTILGVINTNEQFRKWAVAGFVTGVAGVVLIWAKSQSPPDFFVNLEPPPGVKAETFELIIGNYVYWTPSSPTSSTSSGSVELTVGQELGWWRAKFPYDGQGRSVKLELQDSQGRWWVVHPFYPNYNRKLLTEIQAPPRNASVVIPHSILISDAVASGVKIKVNNYAKEIRTEYGKTYYKWRVFIDEPDQVLNRIAEIQYLLHPTYPEPLQIRTNPGDKFAVEATGWGQFLMQIEIKYKDQSTQTTSYLLNFDKEWP